MQTAKKMSIAMYFNGGPSEDCKTYLISKLKLSSKSE